ncbi:MAG: long-chain fatty acid--CoA ligase [Campylobacterota bacterium]
MHWLLEKFSTFGDNIAVIDQGRGYTYAQLLERIETFKTLLQEKKVQSGEVVGLIGEYGFENIALLLALAANKNIIVPITPMPKEEMGERIEEAYVDVVAEYEQSLHLKRCDHGQKHTMINDLRQKRVSGLILFSSGSTGRPKAMIHDFDTFVAHYQNRRPKKITMLLFLMFDHIGGLNSLLSTLSMGAAGVIAKKREVGAVCALIEKHRIKVLPASPTFLNLLLMSDAVKTYDLSSLRMITYGTEAMPESLLKRLKKKFPKVKFLQTFGTSETGIAATVSKASDSTYMKIGDNDLEYKTVEGELWLKSKTQVLGYLNASMESFENGWFKTGDLVEELEDGYLKIIGRSRDVINVGGQKVLPGEVESAILELPEFSDVLVSGEKNAITGQSVTAKVVSRDLSNKEAKRLIREHLKAKLEEYKIPTKVKVVESLGYSSRFKKVRG